MNEVLFAQAVSQLDDKYYQEAEQYHGRGHRWAAGIAAAACLALAVAGGASVLERPGADVPDNPPVEEGRGEQITGIFNGPVIAGDADVVINSYEKVPYDVWEAMKADFALAAGEEYDAFLARIPEPFQSGLTVYTVSARGETEAGLAEEYTIHDYVFACQGEDGAWVSIALCGFEFPIRECMVWDENPEQWWIGGTPVEVSRFQDQYFARFSCRGAYYDLEAAGVDDAGLEELLAGLIG